MQITYLKSDDQIFQIDTVHLTFVPFFRLMLKNPDTYGLGTFEDPLFLDFDSKTTYHIIEYVRNGESYQIPSYLAKVIQLLLSEEFPPSKKNFLEICVGGKCFLTTATTLSKLEYFDIILNKRKENIPKYIDRSPKAFVHILAHLRNPDYLIPEKYHYELLFYGNILISEFTKQNIVNDCTDDVVPLAKTEYLQKANFSHVESYMVEHPEITFFREIYRRHINFTIGHDMICLESEGSEINFILGKHFHLLGRHNFVIIYPKSKTNNIFNKLKSLIWPPSVSDIIQNIQLVCGDLDLSHGPISGHLLEFLMKNVYHGDHDRFLAGLKSGYIFVPLYFYNMTSYALSIPNIRFMEPLTITVRLTDTNTESYFCQLYYENIVTCEMQRTLIVNQNNIWDNLTRYWEEFEVNFQSGQLFDLNLAGSYEIIFFEIQTKEEIDLNTNFLISAYIYNWMSESEPDDNLKKWELVQFTDSLLSDINMESLGIYAKEKNVYVFKFCLGSMTTIFPRIDRDSDSFGSVSVTKIQSFGYRYFNPKHKIRLLLNTLCSEGLVRFWAMKFDVLHLGETNYWLSEFDN